MLFNGISIVEGSELQNLTVASGSTLPTNAKRGELFFLVQGNSQALYVNNGGAWVRIADEHTQLTFTPVNKAGDTMTGRLTLSGDPVQALDAATRQFVVNYSHSFSSLNGKPSTLSGYGISDAQPLDNDLTAIANLSSNGFVSKTGNGTAATRSINGSAGRISVTNGDGISGNPTLDLVPVATANRYYATNVDQYGRTTGGSTSISTSEVDEGVNLYHTDARVRNAIGVSGSLTYEPSTGVISYTAPIYTTATVAEGAGNLYFTNARARNAISASGDLAYDAATGVISYTAPVSTTGNITEGSNLYFTNARARAAVSASGDLTYNPGSGVFSYTTPTSDGIAEGVTSLYYTDARARASISVDGNLSYSPTTGVISYITPSTDGIVEGLANKYFTTVRARAAISAGGDLSYNSSTGVVSYTVPTTDGITEGSSNLFFTNARARNAIAVSGSLSYDQSSGVISYTEPTLNTDIVVEGSNNLFYTNDRARHAISVAGSLSYNQTTGVISYNEPALSTSNISEGSNLYYTDTRVRNALAISAGTSGVTYSGGLFNFSSVAPLASPAFTGNPTTPTAAAGASTTQIASTEFVANALSNFSTGNIASASKWSTARTINVTGDAAGSVTLDGTSNVVLNLTMPSINSAVGTFGSASSTNTISVNSKGTITGITNAPIAIDASQVSGVLSDALVKQSNVTQHQASLSISEAQLVDGTILPRLAADETVTGAWTFDQRVSGRNPQLPTHFATKLYVDNLVTGLDFKQSCRAATTSNITLSGLQTIDGVTVIAGNRVLVKNQTDAKENGIYTVDVSVWTRAADADNSPIIEISSGMYCFIEEGTINASTGWVLASSDPVMLGSTDLLFTQFTGLGQIAAGNGLSKSGSTLSVSTASDRITSGVSGIDLGTVSDSGTGAFKKISVDSYGRVIGTSPVTTSDLSSLLTTSNIAEGTNQYFTTARAIASPLSGYTVGANSVVAASDTILSAFGKTQKQISDLQSANTGDETRARIISKIGFEPVNKNGDNVGYLESDQTWHTLDVIKGDFGVESRNYLQSGGGGSGQGGRTIYKDDSNVSRWMDGLSANAGVKNYQLYDLANARAIYTVSYTTGMMSFNTPISTRGIQEMVNVSTAPTVSQNVDVITSAVHYYTAPTSNFTLNVRGDSTTPLSTYMANGSSITFAFIVSNGATGYYPTSISIDGVTVTPKWNGTAPTIGNTSAVDVYSYTIIRANSSWTVLASRTKYA